MNSKSYVLIKVHNSFSHTADIITWAIDFENIFLGNIKNS